MDIRPILSALHRHRTAAALIVIEIALSCAIVCNVLFLVNERVQDLRRPSGIAEDELLVIRLLGIGKQVDADARTREDLAALRSLAGVSAATTLNQVPFQQSAWNTSLQLSADQEEPTLNAAEYLFGPGTLQALGLKLTAGRDFNAGEYKDEAELDKVGATQAMSGPVLVSAAAARKLFPDGSAVGKTIYMANIPMTIIGVVETLARPNNVTGEWNYSVVFPIQISYGSGGRYLIRVTDAKRRDEVLENATAVLERIDPNRLLRSGKSYSDSRSDYFSDDRDMIGLLILVSVLLLVITALGIVGLASFWVQQRTKQIGIRRALGATRGQILRYFQTENFLLVSTGIVLGMLMAYALNLLLMSKYELPRLPLAYLPVGAALLWLLGQLAVLGPARRAAAVPPAVATRSA